MFLRIVERTQLHNRTWWKFMFRLKQLLHGSKWVVAGALIFREDGKVLLIKHRWRGGWEYPVGMTDGTESPMDAARRELSEEVGLAPSNLKLIGIDFFHRHTPNGNLVLTFAAQISQSDAGRVALDPLEATDYRWVTRGEALKLVEPWLNKRLAELFLAYDANRPVYLHKGVPVGE